ncbi:MAG: carbohydrate ABC transporter permease [Acidimicrobiia bacterium]|nr:carbohydrate ABC transporter permease [Acidimicrobiia bacterium]
MTGRYLLLIVVAAAVLFPVYAAFMVSQKPLTALGDLGVLVPDTLDLGGFDEAARDANMGRYLLNSAIVAVLITVGQVVTSILAGYAFAALRFPAKTLLFTLFLATLMVPGEVNIVVNLETIQKLGWIDSYQALVVPFLAFSVGTFLLRQAFLGIPQDLRDAAAMDGHGHWSFLVNVAVPLVRPTIGALSVFSFLLAWNQYLWPLLVTNDDDYRTVQIGLKALTDEAGANLGLLMSATLLASLPIVIVLVLFERQLIRGLTTGSLKG